jgi:CHAT domain-containing protein/Tfp pilus assembly protein PilF
LALAERVAAGSADLARNLGYLGNLAFDAGELDDARAYHERALEIREGIASGSLDVAASLNNLGNVALHTGDLDLARDYHRRSFAIREHLDPGSLAVAGSLNNLGLVAASSGAVQVAHDFYQRSLEIKEKISPNSRAVSISLQNLGNIAYRRGDFSAARSYHLRALKINESLPNDLEVASSLHNLGSVALEQGDLNGARDFYQRALAINEKLAPLTLVVTPNLISLGDVALAQGNLREAREYHVRALAIRDRLAPNSLAFAAGAHALGRVTYAQGDLGLASDLFRRAYAIRERLAPGSLDLAVSLSHLAQTAHDQGDLASAVEWAAQSWDIVQAQAATVTGDEARQLFGSQYRPIGSQLVRYQVALGKIDEAFGALEEGRAQALLQLLAGRGIARRLAPGEVWRRYELAQAASDRAGKALENAGAAEGKAKLALESEVAQQSAVEVIQERLRVLKEREQATEQARQASVAPRVEAERRWAEVRHTIETAIPAPANAAEARRALPADAVLVVFNVGEEASTVFLVRRDGPVEAFAIQTPLRELTARVDFVRRTVSGEPDGRGIKLTESDSVRVTAARDLYQKLFPAEARQAIGKARRVLLSPDGPLWDLPFAALVINDQGTPQYLGLEKPLAYAQSLTTLAQTTQAAVLRRTTSLRSLVVGNPLFDNALRNRPAAGAAADQTQGELVLLSRDNEAPAPLPYAEVEARQVAALYRGRASSGIEPTEAWFRQRVGEADVIHLATHGYFNPFRPVSSGVRLAVPAQEPGPGETDNDGALQAWEVFGLQMRADLVVLSACQTGLGAKVPGEGLVGLTRAFQVAGAASVVATQWSVADKSTASGMVVFHQRLLKGLARDEALRQAMRTLASEPSTAHPRYWAPFVLIGDYRPLRSSSTR